VLVNQLTTQRASTSGVSLDEETINLITYQKAYQAAARIVTVMDEMLDTLINHTGIQV
jgi:flagellar hook-associated protein 1 FlgK